MKIAASDFDGTLFRERTISAEDAAAIRRWRAEGHMFGIVTGRGRDMLLKDARRFSVPYDFLICNNGAAIYDAAARDLYRAALPAGVAAAVLEHPGTLVCRNCIFFSGAFVYAHADKTTAWIVRDISLPQLPPEELRQLPEVHQISLAYADAEQAECEARRLACSLGDSVTLHRSGVCIDITGPGVSKAAGMKRVLRLRRWETAEVLVIGDAGNDIPMIRHFQGYAVDNAGEEARNAARGLYPSVGSMLRAHLE